ncbi:MAG TPA: aldo/keto reductase [Chloroflexota bacterium]|nr:aldo/keto reductase [Chloroflexota bacterium]
MIATQPFGRTGHQSTRTIFGAAALGDASQDVADRTLEVLQRYGVNHIDVAASYGDAEERIGPWMGRHRGDFFLATKTGARDRAGAREELHRSLDRLQTDHVDLWQLHNLVDPAEWDEALSPGGALDAAVEAREQGLVRFIGVTGHGSAIPAMHRRSLERFDFDSVLLPYSYVIMQEPDYAADFEALAAICVDRNVAMQTIKSIAAGPWWGQEHTANTWYRPLTTQGDIDHAVWWVLGRPDIFLNTVGDVDLLPKVLDAASRFEERPSDEEMTNLTAQREMVTLFP